MKLIDALRYQRLTGRTKGGMEVGEKVMPDIDALVGSWPQGRSTLVECSNCELLLGSELFAEGCPNCGSKDFEPFSVKKPAVRKDK